MKRFWHALVGHRWQSRRYCPLCAQARYHDECLSEWWRVCDCGARERVYVRAPASTT